MDTSSVGKMTAGDAFGSSPESIEPRHCCLNNSILTALHQKQSRRRTKKAPCGALEELRRRSPLKGVSTWQNLFREDEFFVGLVCGSHPGAQPLVEQDVFGVEGFELRILSRADFL